MKVFEGLGLDHTAIDNAKIFSQLMSKSRSLAKRSERSLQSLLVCEITDWKLGFSTLLQGQRGGGHGTVPMGVRRGGQEGALAPPEKPKKLKKYA